MIIIEHNLGVLSRIVLNLFVVAEARVVLGPNIEARCSYEIVLIKKAWLKEKWMLDTQVFYCRVAILFESSNDFTTQFSSLFLEYNCGSARVSIKYRSRYSFVE